MPAFTQGTSWRVTLSNMFPNIGGKLRDAISNGATRPCGAFPSRRIVEALAVATDKKKEGEGFTPVIPTHQFLGNIGFCHTAVEVGQVSADVAGAELDLDTSASRATPDSSQLVAPREWKDETRPLL